MSKPARRRKPRRTGVSRYARSSATFDPSKIRLSDSQRSAGCSPSPGQTWKSGKEAVIAELMLGLLLLELRRHPERVPAVMAGL